MLRGREVPAGSTESGGSASPGGVQPAMSPKNVARLDDVEKQQILSILEQVRWHRGRAAELLGISPKTLYRKLRPTHQQRRRGIGGTADRLRNRPFCPHEPSTSVAPDGGGQSTGPAVDIFG